MKLCTDCKWVTPKTPYAPKYQCMNEKCGIRQSPVDGSWEYADCEYLRNVHDEYNLTCEPEGLLWEPRDLEKEKKEAEECVKKFNAMLDAEQKKRKWSWWR